MSLFREKNRDYWEYFQCFYSGLCFYQRMLAYADQPKYWHLFNYSVTFLPSMLPIQNNKTAILEQNYTWAKVQKSIASCSYYFIETLHLPDSENSISTICSIFKAVVYSYLARKHLLLKIFLLVASIMKWSTMNLKVVVIRRKKLEKISTCIKVLFKLQIQL